MKKERPHFYAIYKEFNTGKVENYDVIEPVLNSILNDKNSIRKKDFYIWDDKFNRIPVRTKEDLYEYVRKELHYLFAGKCEWEFICIDWPYRDTIADSHPVKIDVYQQLKPNMQVIVDLIWNYLEPKLNKLIQKENESRVRG